MTYLTYMRTRRVESTLCMTSLPCSWSSRASHPRQEDPQPSGLNPGLVVKSSSHCSKAMITL